MKRSAKDVLNSLLELVKMMDSMGKIVVEKEVFYNQLHKINDRYKSLTILEKKNLWILISTNFESDPQLHIFLLSTVLEATEDDEVLALIVNMLINSKLNINQSIYAYLQITRYNFIHAASNSRYSLRRILHESILTRFKEKLSLQFKYRKLNERNSNRIVIVTGVILDINHAPTKKVLEHCYRLQKVLKKEILLVVCPIESTSENRLTWFNPINLLYHKDYENEFYSINYKNESIKTYQLAIKTESIHLFMNLISVIYDFNPLFILSMGSEYPWEDVMSQFTTVAVKEMSVHYPISEALILFCNKGVKPNIVETELNYLLKKGQIPLEYKIDVVLDDAKNLLQRNHLNIDENAFVLVIVGNRLDKEITEEYSDFLERLLEIDNRLNLAFIGEYNKYTLSDSKKDRVYYLGYQIDLSGAYHVTDLFLNPPRNGGGIGALLALYNGVPVVTLPNCDVASNVGKDFICDSYSEMYQIINRYLNDKEFYKDKQLKGLELTHKDQRDDAGLSEMINDIVKAVEQMEQKIML